MAEIIGAKSAIGKTAIKTNALERRMLLASPLNSFKRLSVVSPNVDKSFISFLPQSVGIILKSIVVMIEKILLIIWNHFLKIG